MSKIEKQAYRHNDKSEEQEIIRIMKWIRDFLNKEPLKKIKELEEKYNELNNSINNISVEFDKIRGDYHDVARIAQKTQRSEYNELDNQLMNIVILLNQINDFLINNKLRKHYKDFSDYLYSILTNETSPELLGAINVIKNSYEEIDFSSIMDKIENSVNIRNKINEIIGPDKSITEYLVKPNNGDPFDSMRHEVANGLPNDGATIKECYMFGVYHSDRGAQRTARVTVG